MTCLESSSFKILWNGDKTENFLPSRGIRQGDPLSPYIFVICMKYLSHFIAYLVNNGSCKAMKAGRQGPSISHLIFADGLLLFAEASKEKMHTILKCPNTFCTTSGHKVNPNKTSIRFSKNEYVIEANDITSCGGFSVSKELGRYLGAQIHQGRYTVSRFKNILEKVQSRFCGWKQKCHSKAGRITLAGSVLGGIKSFQMQHEMIPKSVCNSIEKA